MMIKISIRDLPAYSRFLRRLRQQSAGSSMIELAVILPVLLLMLLGAVDLGRAYFAAIEVSSAATSGALYGSRKPSDILGMQAASLLDGADLVGMTSIATWGCQCSDGSAASVACASPPTCATNSVQYVQVNTVFLYIPLMPYPGIPTSIALKGSARLRAEN
jgi:hypothetical protein